MRMLALVVMASAAVAWAEAPATTTAPAVSIVLDSAGTDQALEKGAVQCRFGDGDVGSYFGEVAGRKCWTIPTPGRLAYLYVTLNDPALTGGAMKVRVTATAVDGPGVLQMDYDSYLYPWKSQTIDKGNTGQWKDFVFELPDAGFMHRCNGADFRLTSNERTPVSAIRVELIERVLAPDNFPRKFTLDNPRIVPENLGFSHGGLYWGPNGMSAELHERECRLMKELGFTWYRHGLGEWAEFEREKGKFDWTVADKRLEIQKKYGLKTLGYIGYCTYWGSDAPDDAKGHGVTKYPPKSLQDLADYTFAIVSRYKNDIKYWEGWNEHQPFTGFWHTPPSGGDQVARYIDWQRTMYQAAKKADPTCVVLSGAFADHPPLGRELAEYYQKGLKGTFDVLNIHHYPPDPKNSPYSADQIEAVIRVMRHYGDGEKKIWVTETGWAVANHPQAVTVEKQAEFALWDFAVLLSYPQVEKVFFFQLRDRFALNEPGDGCYFGWFEKDFTPRPVVKRWKEFLKSRSEAKP